MQKCCSSYFSQSIPSNADQNFSGFLQIPFLPNPFYLYENTRMTHMSWVTPTINNSLHIHIMKNASKNYSQSKASVKSKGQIPAPKVKVDLTCSESKVENKLLSLRN